jgi:hypothetical protein
MSVIDSNQRVIVVSSKSFLNTLNGFKDMDEWVVKPQRERSSAGSMYGGHWSLS